MKTDAIKNACKKGLLIFTAVMLGLTILSRSLDTIRIPVVTIENPKRRVLQYKAEGSGELYADEVLSVPVMAGLRIRKVFVSGGESVTRETPLFAYQLDGLEAEKDKLWQELERLKIDLASEKISEVPVPSSPAQQQASRELGKAEEKLGQATDQLEAKRQEHEAYLEKLRMAFEENQSKTKDDFIKEKYDVYLKADQDYQTTVLNEESELKQLNWNVTDAQRAYDDLEGTGSAEEIRDARSALERARQNLRLGEEKWQISVDQAHYDMNQKYNEYMAVMNGETDPLKELKDKYEEDVRSAEATFALEKEKLETAEENYQDAAAGLEDAQQNDNYSDISNSRTIEKSKLTQRSYQLQIEEKEKELERITALIEQDGIVLAIAEGILTRQEIAAGALTSGSEQVQIGTGGVIFRAEMDKDTAKNFTNDVNFSLARENRPLSVSSHVRSIDVPEDKDMAVLTATLEDSELLPGTVLEYTCETKSSPYDITIPLTALHKDNSGEYVLVVEERDTIMGTERNAVRINVTVIGRSDTTVAVTGGLSTQDQVIVGSSKYIENGDRVRTVDE